MQAGFYSIKKPRLVAGLFSSWFWVNNLFKSLSDCLQAEY
jgi:hypothetical protein